MKRWLALWAITTCLAAGIGYTMGRMTAPDLQLAYAIECSPEQMERVKRLAGEYRARGRSVVSALTMARMEVCL